jgi:hypothetical protein
LTHFLLFDEYLQLLEALEAYLGSYKLHGGKSGKSASPDAL